MSADTKQVGGTHYKVEGELQHWNVVAAMGWDYFIGNATKYLWRLGKKGGPEKELEDLQKAIHYLEKKQEVLRAKLAQRVPAPGTMLPIPGVEFSVSGGLRPHGTMASPLGAPSYKVDEYDGGPTRAYVNQD